MNRTTLENNKKLYDLSGWDDTEKFYDDDAPSLYDPTARVGLVPIYDLAYLLNKLPKRIKVKGVWQTLAMGMQVDYYLFRYGPSYRVVAVNPTDAATKLCIKLLKEGILKK